MLWHKAWLETRGRFFGGLALSLIVGFGVIYDFRATERLLPLIRNMDPGALDTSGPIGAAIKEGIAAQQTFRGFVWWQWYRENLTYLVVIFGALLGAGGLLARSGSATLFTLSLPVSRNRLIGTRAALGLAELLAIAIVPSLVLPLLAPSIGQSYSVIDVMVHGVCMFIVGSVFFSLAALLWTLLFIRALKRRPVLVDADGVTMRVFVRGDGAMIAASVQCDVDEIPKGSQHYIRVPIAIGAA